MLEHLTRDVEWQVFGVDDALDEVQVLGDELFTVVHDEDPADVQLDVVLLFLVLKQVEGGALGDEEEGAELQLSLNREMLHCQMLFPVVGQALVELAILFLADVIWIPCPDGLGLIKLFIFGVFLL